jgi:hypothetical protein
MSVFTPGVGGDLHSTNLPAALLEVAQKAQLAEQGLTPAKTNITVAVNGEGNLATITAQIPVTMIPSAVTGKLELTGVDYIV